MSDNSTAAVQSPLGVESGFAAARAALLAIKEHRQLSAAQGADLLFLEGMAEFEQMLASAGGGEDSEPDPALHEASLKHLAAAVAAFRTQQRPVDEACSHFRMARALERMAGRVEAFEEARQHYEQGLELLDTFTNPALAFDAYLNLGAVQAQIAARLEGAARDTELGGALAALQAAEFLASGLSEPICSAMGKRAAALVLAERFLPDRDQNLLDATALAEDALPYFRHAPERAIEYGSLLVQLGNSWLKANWDRPDALERARVAFSEGLCAIDAQRAPRLHRVLAGNLAMTEQLIETKDFKLPEREMVGRFNTEIETNVEAGRLGRAIGHAWAFLRWGWSLPAPNVHVGAAHKILGNLYFRQHATAAAEMHLYCSVAVLSAVLTRADPWFPMVAQAKSDLTKFFESSGRPEIAASALAQAERAVAMSDEHLRRGAQQIETDAAAALTAFEEALRLFPASPNALFYRGVMRMQAGQSLPALADFDASLSFRPANIPALGNRCTMHLALGDRDGALDDCNAILEIDPAHDSALFNRAQLKSSKDDWDGAIADYGALLELHPGSPQFIVARAGAREKKGDLAGAADDLELALSAVGEIEQKQALMKKIGELRAAAA